MRYLVILVLVLWATRLPALEVLPLHNDEGLHLTRAVEVWRGHPFWAISDGKIINHWPIAAFYPRNAPVFVARIATVLVSVPGLAAGLALARRFSGEPGMLLAGALWIGSPYLFFYERLAFSDAEAGALVVVAVWLAVRLADSGGGRDAVLTGLALAAAMLMKFTAAPFALAVALVVLANSRYPLSRRIVALMPVAGVVVAGFVIPLGYLLLRGGDVFSIAFGWLGGSSGQGGLALAGNMQRLWAQLTGFGTISWVALLVFGLALLAVRRGRSIVVAWALPLLLMMIFGREVLSRHYVVALPLALVLAGAGLALGMRRFKRPASRQVAVYAALVALALGVVPFALTAYADPAALPLPAEVRYEHVTSHSSGYGLSEAVASFPDTLERTELPVIGSMFPDSCRRANFYAVDGRTMICTDAPGVPAIKQALAEHGAVYVLADNTPLIGVDVNTLDAEAVRLAGYPRPGETEANASLVLWLVER
ncbi:MAG: glycosyltransferase family 39 protein [Chloroflexi bacterium]|nr:glycosyltransferase family 39 protein [Chloroflexota bacterium]